MKIDKYGAQVFLSNDHHKVHAERMYSASVSNAAIGAAGTLALSITTPDTKAKTHIKVAIDSNKAGVAILAEGDVISVGSAVTAVNMNRSSETVYAGTLKKDATRDTPGTTLRTLVIAAPGVVGSMGHIRNDTEWNLKKNTTYTFLFTADGATTAASINAEFYEE